MVRSVLLVSHDRFFIDKIATKLALLQNRRLEPFSGTYGDYLNWRAKQAE